MPEDKALKQLRLVVKHPIIAKISNVVSRTKGRAYRLRCCKLNCNFFFGRSFARIFPVGFVLADHRYPRQNELLVKSFLKEITSRSFRILLMSFKSPEPRFNLKITLNFGQADAKQQKGQLNGRGCLIFRKENSQHQEQNIKKLRSSWLMESSQRRNFEMFNDFL